MQTFKVARKNVIGDNQYFFSSFYFSGTEFNN